jgi:hypothetical protein
MFRSDAFQRVLTAAIGLAVLLPDAHALLRLNQGKDLIHLTVNGQVGWDSNLFSTANGQGDVLAVASIVADYQRRAGAIGLDAAIGLEAGHFNEYDTEDYLNPRASVEFTKSSGRTTGSWASSATRKSQGDVAASLRAESWDYDTTLNLRYPVIERYSITGSVGYARTDYLNSPILIDLNTTQASSDLLYAINSQRDLIAGYRYRVSDSAADTVSRDNAFIVGLSGKILPKVSGTVRAGYQSRQTKGLGLVERNDGLTAATSATWNINGRSSLTAQVTHDFATTSTDVSTDSSAYTLDYKAAFNPRWSATAGAGLGFLEFLGQRGAGRSDTYATASLGVTWKRSDRLAVSLSYAHLSNWSTLALADYARHTVSLGVSSRF